MNTQLAINLLTTNQNNLTATLAALGLLSNGETINTLRQKLDLIIKTAFEEQQKLSSKVDIIEEKVQQSNEKLELAVSHNTTEQERLLNLKKEQGELQIAVKTLEDKKKILGNDGNGKKADIKKEIETIKENIGKTDAEIKKIEWEITDGVNLVARYDSLLDQANQLTAEANSIQDKVNNFKQNLPILKDTKDSKTVELWLYYHEWDAKINVLSFAGIQSDNELALINLQLEQAKEDLQQLQITEIPNQEEAVEGTNQRVTQVQSELDQLRSDKGFAQKDLDTFVKDNQELLTTDLSLGLLKDAIAKVQGTIASLQGDLTKPNQSVDVLNGLNKQIGVEQGKLEQLKQQYQLLALEELGVNQERLESFNGQLASEVSVNDGVKINTIEGYVVLVPQLVQQLTGLSDIWVGNLKENYRFTVEVNNLFQNNLTVFEDLTDYIGDNLADPYGDYVLNKVQLDEAIVLQDTQVKYRDALAKAVDDLGENIALQKKSVEQSDELSGKLEHIRDLRSFEQGYGDLQNALSKLTSVDKADYEWSDQKVKKIAEDLLNKLEGNEQYKLVADKLRLALNNYNTFATANLQVYTNKYQGYLDIQRNQISDVKKIQDEKDSKSQEAIRNWQAVRSDVTGNYYFLTPARDWSGAQAFAQSAGGNLVTINNQDEQNWLFQRYKSYVWIGLSDHIQEGVWRWVSGEPVTYSNWLPGQPDNFDGIEDFVQLNLTGDGRWNDLPHVGIHNGNIPGIVELNFQKYDQQIQAVNDKATADKARVADELQSLHDQGIKVLISQTAEALRPLLIDEVSEEIDIKVSNLPNQIELSLSDNTFKNPANSHSYVLVTNQDTLTRLINFGGYAVSVNDEQERSWLIDKFGTKSTSLAIQLIPGIQVTAVVHPLNEQNPIIVEIDSQQVVDQKLKQQEQWIETNLQEYVEAKESQVIQTKEQQLALIGQKVRPSSALYFDGVNDYISMGVKSSFEMTNTFTIEAWIKPQQKGSNGIIVSREGEYMVSVDANNRIYLALANTSPGWGWWDTGYTVTINKWTHLTVSYDKGLIKVYGDGNLVSTYDGTGSIGDFYVHANEDDLRIGNQEYRNSDYFKGEIDEVRVWNITRTQAEIQTNFNQKLSGKEQGLVGYWNFEESTGNTVNDLTANSNHGMLINGVQRTVANSNSITRPEGKALYFDGVNDYINAGTNLSLEVSSNLTLEAWINPPQDSRHRVIVGREGEYLLAVSGLDNTIYYAVANTNPSWNWISTGYGVKSNQWSHIAFSFESGRIKAYVNGELIYKYDGVGAIVDAAPTNLNELRIGNRQWNNYDSFKGEIDEVRVWNVARTQAEIQTNLSQKLSGKERGLVGYWNFEETSGHIVNDLTANSNHGMLINRVQRTIKNNTQVKYQPSNALYFDGVNDSVKVSHSSSLDLVNKWTLEAWIFRNTTGRIDPIIEKYNWQAGFGGFTLRVTDTNKLIASVINGVDANVVESSSTINSQQWYHVSATFDGSQKTLKLYVNGVLAGVNTDVTITPISSNVSLKIGERGDDLQPRYWYYNGQIDDVRIWNVARTQAEIQANLSQKLSGNEQGLAGYWNFEEATGNTVNDLTTNKNNGTLFNGVQRTVANANPITRPEGKALYFDGVNDYINAGTDSSLEVSKTLTLEAWIKPQAHSTTRLIAGREGEYLLAVSGIDNIIFYAIANTAPGFTWISTGYSIKSDEWSHIAFSYDNGLIKTYVNGKLIYTYEGSGNIGDHASHVNNDEFRIGNRQWGNYDSFKGEIDEVRVWTVARTQAEIQANLSQRLTGNEQGLAGYWNFEETSGHIVNDLTANSNHGMLINGVQRTVANANTITRPEGKALYFDGVNDYVNVGVKSSLELSTNLTLEAWINPQQQLQQYGGIIVSREGEYQVIVGADSSLILSFANTNPSWTGINTGYVVKTNQWTHLAISYETGLIKTYANGLLVYTYDGVGSLGDAHPNEDEFRIGYRQAGFSQFFKGEMDDVRVWNITRSQAEIQANLSQRLTGKEQGLVGYWNFEESSGNTVYDLTVNDNDGTLINGTQRTIDSSVSIPLVTAQQIQVIEDKTISDLQKLRLETVYLTLQAEKDPDKLQNYLQQYQSISNRKEQRLLSWQNSNQPTIDGTFNVKASFTPSLNYVVKANNYNYQTGDFNGDGKTDLIHFDVNNYVHIWTSKGDGTFAIKDFTPGGGYGVGVNNYNYKTGDFNGDGKTDLIHFDVNNYVHLWYSQGDGNFTIKNFTPGSGYGVGVNN